MANPDHVAQLRAGQWNDWRAANPNLAPDLIDADLAGMDLRGLNFSKAHLKGANLSGANLDGADLTRAIDLYQRACNGGVAEACEALTSLGISSDR